MVTCPRCEAIVDSLHPLPPETISHDLVIALDNAGDVIDFEACGDCIHELMEE